MSVRSVLLILDESGGYGSQAPHVFSITPKCDGCHRGIFEWIGTLVV